MSSSKVRSLATRWLLGAVGTVALVVAGISGVSSQTTFPANAGTLGPIPDGSAGVCGTPLGSRDVTFTVSGLSGAPTNVSVDMTFGSPTHTWSGDLSATLIAPSAASFIVFANRGAATPTACGSSNDIAGLFAFNDAATNTTFWTSATNPVPVGTYRTTAPLTGAVTTMNPAFAGVSNPNGTWTLKIVDGGGGDTGAVTAANLTLTAGSVVPTADGPLDYNGDGKTDYTVVRNIGGGSGGQIRWYYNLNGTATTVAKDWGISSDEFISGNWDSDSNDDIAVWRSGPAGTAAFYILKSSDFSAIVEPFGQTGDDPSVVDDYNNDGKTDFAVYRGGANPGDPSTWFYRTTAGGPVNYVPWGQNGDFPVPGDFDGNGSADFCVQRNAGGGQAGFWIRLSTGTVQPVQIFGNPSDIVVPGDYDADGKTDIATARLISGTWNWFWRPSGGGADVLYIPFGATADFLAQGDYDGDGKTDVGIWRPSATPGASGFWTRATSSGAVSSVPFGQNGDYSVGNYNTH